MKEKYNQTYNLRYDFENPQNIKEIESVESYDLSSDTESYSNGQEVSSPWGINQIIRVWSEDSTEYCLKKIIINPLCMLSLQKHRGRSEVWSVIEGVLTVILDGKIFTVEPKEKISIPKGSAHCMINMTNAKVVVEEIQQGTCREKDNIRLMDFLGRSTYPLTSETEYQSYLLYCETMKTIQHSKKENSNDTVL